jgi:hypothetical protein
VNGYGARMDLWWSSEGTGSPARRVHWDDADHFPSMRHPARFAELVAGFLRAIRP